MKLNLRNFLSLALIGLLMASCSTSSDLASNSPIKKRRYTKGFHVDLKKKNKQNKAADKSENTSQFASNESLSKPWSHDIDDLNAIVSSKKEFKVIKEKSFATKAESTIGSEILELPEEEYISNSQRRKEIKQALKQYRAKNQPAAVSGEPSWLYYVLAIIIPPLAIGLLYGITTEFWISLVLTLLFWLPGAIYSIIKTLQWYGDM